MIPIVPAAQAFAIPSQPVVELGAFRSAASTLPSLLDLPYQVMTRSGRSALLLALKLSGVLPGDRVLVPTYHCPTMIAPVERLAARPLFYPLDDSGDPDVARLSETDCSGVRAMLVAHLFGLPRTLRSVAKFCRERGILLIEDCAHCFFGSAEGRAVGTSGDFAIGSLPKFFPVLEGGLLAWSSGAVSVPLPGRPRLTAELRALWDLIELSARTGRLGLVGSAARRLTAVRGLARRSGGPDKGDGLDTPSPETIRETGLADPLLEPAPLRRVESWIVRHSDLDSNCRHRRENFLELTRRLGGLTGAQPLFSGCGPDAAPYVMPLRIEDPQPAYSLMRRMRLPVFRWDYVWPGTPAIAGDAAVTWTRGVVQIACHQSLRPDDVARVAAATARCVQATLRRA
jgi:hypothetical protein